METRLLNERDPLRRNMRAVQCALRRHGPDVKHEWMGREFGAPAAKRAKSRKPNRCTATEDRVMGRGSPSDPEKIQMVRCSLSVHGEDVEHEWNGRKFGTLPKARPAGKTRWHLVNQEPQRA